MQINLAKIYEVPQGKVHYRKSSAISGQDYSISELLTRLTNGQRLNVGIHLSSPDQDRLDDLEEKNDPDGIPEIYEDIVDLEAATVAHQMRKSEYAKRKRQIQAKPEGDEPKSEKSNKPAPGQETDQ